MLDLDSDAAHADRRPRRRRLGLRRRSSGSPTWSRRRCAPARRCTSSATATSCWPAPTSAGRSGWCSPGTSTPCRSPTTCPRASTATAAARLRDVRHEVRASRCCCGWHTWSARGALDPRVDLTFVCYDCEEIEAVRNGLGRLARERPEALAGDLAMLLEPTDGVVEGGCQGTLRVVVDVPGVRAHSARSWLGDERDPRRRAGAAAAGRLPGARRRRRRADLPRGPQRGRRSAAASPATWCPTCARSPSTTASPRTGRRTRRSRTCARCSPTGRSC